jgi:predicted tellurium resistance membrane protein TerC
MKTIGNSLPTALRLAALLIGLAGATALRAEAFSILL